MRPNSRSYRLAGLTVRVEADLAITDATFRPHLRLFEHPTAAPADLLIRHHFEPPGWKSVDLGERVYRRPPWAVFRRGDTWIYQGLLPPPREREPWVLCVIDHGHSRADIYHADSRIFAAGGAESLSLLPTDQIVLGRTLADHQAFYLHAGGLVIDGQGFVFAGHSGAGKSTLAKMLKGKGTELLCDDRVVVRRWPDGFRVHGTWSRGEVPDVSAGEGPLRRVFLLKKATASRIVPLDDPRQGLRQLLPLVIRPLITADWWEKILAVAGEMVADVPVCRLEFDRTGDAKELLRAYANEVLGAPR